MSKSNTPAFAFEKSGRYYRTSGNYAPDEQFGGEYEFSDPVSLTIPDQALSVQALIERHRRGLGIVGYREPVYYGDTLVPPIENMDFAEKKMFLEHIKEHRATIEAVYESEKDEAYKAKKQAEFDALVEAEILKRSTE